MKLCKDCKYFTRSERWVDSAWCARYRDPVMGEATVSECAKERSHGHLVSSIFGVCGKKARFFEEKV